MSLDRIPNRTMTMVSKGSSPKSKERKGTAYRVSTGRKNPQDNFFLPVAVHHFTSHFKPQAQRRSASMHVT